MSSQVFYRKWRPQSFGEVAGQEHVTQTLRNAIGSGHISHAYLFCGPRGTGKTSTGRILAKAVNCLNSMKGEPCNKCEICQAFNDGKLLDIIEIDAASNRGIEEIRDLRQKVNYAPGLARFKVYIIDEVHMLTDPASNALLKTLEEPPTYSIFVLATTEPHRVLPTILSRCQRFDFRRISQAAVVDRLSFIGQQEAIVIPEEGLRLIARAATGSLRDAANLIEQVVAYYGKEVSFEQVREMLGVTGDSRIAELARCILGHDTASSLRIITAVNADGLDLRQFNRELVQFLRDLLLIRTGSEDTVDVTPEDLADMKKLVAGISIDHLLKVVRLFNNVDLRLDSYTPLPLELAIIEATIPEGISGTSRILKTPEPEPRSAEIPAKPVKPAEPARFYDTARTSKSVAGATTSKSAEQEFKSEPPVSRLSEVTEVAESAKPPAPVSVDSKSGMVKAADIMKPVADRETFDLSYLKTRWKDFVESMRGVGSSGNLDAFLRNACEPVEFDGDTITLAFYYDFHKAKIEDPKYRFLVEKKLLEVFGKPYHVRCVLTERNKKDTSTSVQDNYMAKAAIKMGARIVNKKPVTEGQ